MAETLKLIANMEISVDGEPVTVKQGAASDNAKTAFEISVTGNIHHTHGSLSTASVRTLFDDDNDDPADFDYAIFWSDQDCYIQFIGASTNFAVKVEAKVPFIIPGFDSLYTAANTTAITGGTEPTMEDIDSIVLGNYSGETLRYKLLIID